jgi:hypothetical protein
MNSFTVRSLLAAALAALAGGATSAAAEWNGRDPVFNPDNGHYYTAVGVLRPVTFEAALAAAAATSHEGIPGHLATITSLAEHDFIVAAFSRRLSSRWTWIGASDAAIEGEWRWVAGPETGELFWLGNENGTAVGFEAWMKSVPTGVYFEPNDLTFGNVANRVSEDFAQMLIYPQLSTLGQRMAWNDNITDNTTYASTAYLVEFSPIAEPSAHVLLATAVACAARLRPRRRPLQTAP